MKGIYRKSFVWAIVGLVSIFLVSPALCADFPTKPITYYVPWSAGATDAVARVLANETSKILGQPIVVENKPGGAGTLGPITMSKAKPDGYTISEMPGGIFRAPHLYTVPYNTLEDFTYIIHLTGYLSAVVVKKDSPFKTFADLVAFARANPGKLTYTTTGATTQGGIAMQKLAKKYNINWTMVPVKGSSEFSATILGGHVMAGVSSGFGPLVKSGDFRLLMAFSETRHKNYPDVPTPKELGYEISSTSTYGLAGPKGMDPKIVKILHDAFKKGLETPAYQKILDQNDMPSLYLNTQDYVKFAKALWLEEKENVEMLGLKAKP